MPKPSRKLRSRAYAASLRRCPPTCPAVDASLDQLLQGLQWGEGDIEDLFEDTADTLKRAATYRLRGALVRTCADLIRARAEVSRLKITIQRVTQKL